MRAARHVAALACAVLLCGGIAWAGGFAAFTSIARAPQPEPPRADAIVVLTGGAERVDTGFRLLSQGRAPLLLVSGVGGGTDLADLSHRVPLSSEDAARVTLGRAATSTLGNADETAAWLQDRGVRSLLVVTAGYHMPRALLELGRALPGVALHPVAVQPPALKRGLEFATVRMLATEYDKYIAVRLGLTRRSAWSP